MIKKAVIISSIILLGMMGNPAYAQRSIYTSFDIGATILGDAETSSSATGLSFESEYETGIFLSGALGFAFGNGLRLEGEIIYSESDIDRVSIKGVGTVPGLVISPSDASGDIAAFAIMGNAAIDFFPGALLTPYVFGGIGSANINLSNVKSLQVKIADDDQWVFAFQLGAGVKYSLSDRLSLGISYRYFGTEDLDLKDTTGNSFEYDYGGHNILFGITYRL